MVDFQKKAPSELFWEVIVQSYDVELARRLDAEYHFTPRDLGQGGFFERNALNTEIKLAQWLVTKYPFTASDAKSGFLLCLMGNRLATAQWLFSHFSHFDLRQWFVQLGQESRDVDFDGPVIAGETHPLWMDITRRSANIRRPDGGWTRFSCFAERQVVSSQRRRNVSAKAPRTTSCFFG